MSINPDREMPIGLYSRFEISPPCGLRSAEDIIGYLDVPDSFLDPGRVRAGLLWFAKGFVEYEFPNNGVYRLDARERRLAAGSLRPQCGEGIVSPDGRHGRTSIQ